VNGDEQVELSVVTVTPDGLEAIGRTLAALRAQTARDRIELVVVGSREPPADASSFEGFAATRLVAVGRLECLGHAIASGVQAATGPIVAYSEEHSYPDPGWAAALIERHRGPWAAVGWALENPNPATRTSWAHLLSDFGPAVAPVAGGERRGGLPWHHVSYKRAELAAWGDELGEMLEAEGILHERLLARGGRLYLESAVASRHLNLSRLRYDLSSHFYGGRKFGFARARLEAWSAPRRLAYAIGFPLVPVVRLRRLLPDIRRVRPVSGIRRGLIPLLVLGLAVEALGEAVGYLCGAGRSRQLRLRTDLHRARHLSAADAGWMADGPAPERASYREVSGPLPRIAPP